MPPKERQTIKLFISVVIRRREAPRIQVSLSEETMTDDLRDYLTMFGDTELPSDTSLEDVAHTIAEKLNESVVTEEQEITLP